MNYRMTQEFKVPFKVYPVIQDAGPFKVPDVLYTFNSLAMLHSKRRETDFPKTSGRTSVENPCRICQYNNCKLCSS